MTENGDIFLGTLEPCPGQYCGRTIDNNGHIGDCDVSFNAHLVLLLTGLFYPVENNFHILSLNKYYYTAQLE